MYLQKIEGINESITFENDVNPRTDLGQNINFYPLKFVKLHRKNLRNINQPILLKEFQFNYSYFFNSPRLKLMSLQQNCVGTDCLNVKPLIYRFKYSTTLLPKIDDLAKDLWGFYNANEISWVSSGYSGFPSFSINDPIAGLVSNISGETKAPNYENSSGGILSEIIYPNSSSVSYQYESNQLSNIGSVGGFRIKKIVTKENFLQPSILDNVTEYVYNSGDKDYRDNPNNFYKLNKFYQFHLNCGSSGQPPCSERDFARLFYTINTEINSFYSRDYIRYTNVSEIHPGNGSINYEYTGFQSNPNALPEKRTFQYWLNPNISNYLETNSTAILGNKTDFSYERGLLKAMTIFDKDGNLVKKIENVWEFNPVGYVPKQVVGLSVFVSNFFKMITTGPPTIYELEFYKHVSKWFYISSTIETTFDRSNSGKKLSIITNYHYNATTKDIDYIKSSNSDGSETFKYFKYINDYPEITSNMIGLNGMSEGIRQCLIKKMNFPVQTITTKKIGGLEFITGGVLSTLYNNGLPYQTFSIDVNATTNLNSIDVFNLSNIDQTNKNFYKSNLFQLRNTNIAYDDNKKLIETSDALTGQHCSLILDKFSENIIATFSNASISGGECGFFDFEDPQNTYNSSIIIDDGHTGLKANRVNGNISGYSYSYSKQFYPTNQTQRYKLSAWVRTQSNYGQTGGKGELVIRAIDNLNNPINTTGAYQVAYIDNTNSQWKYYEAILDYPSVKSLSSNTSGFSVYAVNYNLSDYFDIDDIRIQPLYSECITSTYDQTTALKTSVSDIRSIPNYFEFDHFWREIIFRNSKRQILKEKTYNYGSHICEFWNDDTYAFRKKEDCNNTGVGGSGSNLRPDDYHGFYGSTVTYVVPSYKFSSCVSQKDANDKAQADITSNAQNFANTYGVCLECNDIAHYLDGNVCKPAIRHYWEELCAPIQSPYNTQYPYSTYTHVVIAHEWYEYPDVGVVTPEVITIVQCMP